MTTEASPRGPAAAHNGAMTNPVATRTVPDGPIRARYDDARSPAPSRAELDWYAARLPRDAGVVLDAMCGSGRLLVPLAALGIAIHGADASAASLAVAQVRLDSAGLAATLYRQDATALNLPTRFAAAILDGGAFARITEPEAALEALVRLRAHLVGPGTLLVDARAPSYTQMRPGAPLVEIASVALPDGSQIRMRSETSVDAEARIAHTDARYTHRRGPQPLGEEHVHRAHTWYDADDWCMLLESAGFGAVACERSPREPSEDETSFAVTARA